MKIKIDNVLDYTRNNTSKKHYKSYKKVYSNYNFLFKLSKILENDIKNVNNLLLTTNMMHFVKSIKGAGIIDMDYIKDHENVEDDPSFGYYNISSERILLAIDPNEFENIKDFRLLYSHVYMHEIGHHIDYKIKITEMISEKYDMEVNNTLRELVANYVAYTIADCLNLKYAKAGLAYEILTISMNEIGLEKDERLTFMNNIGEFMINKFSESFEATK